MKVKTKDVVAAYKVIKDFKVGAMNDENALAVWRNIKAFRPIEEEYDKNIEDAGKSLQDEEYKAMADRAQKYNEKLAKYQQEGKPVTEEMKEEVTAINTFFAERNEKMGKFVTELQSKEVDIDVATIDESEMLKALKANDKSFEDMTVLEWLLR